MARRAVRVADLFHRDRFATKLGECSISTTSCCSTTIASRRWISRRRSMRSSPFAERIAPLRHRCDAALEELRAASANVLFEGAQGAMLDVDLGTYPYVTSSNTTAGFAATGTGLGPRYSMRCSASSRRTRRGWGRALSDRALRRLRRASLARRPRVRLGHRPAAPLRLVRCGGAAALDREFEGHRPVHHQARRARRPRHDPHLRRLPQRTAP